ncbi:MAG: RNA 2',3'-cyclic phosphodiesterase [Endomicrobia bacterium]|nr:RNA 2',3'-cyclic phosphodiesterase [Endomicrobiia bacterium]
MRLFAAVFAPEPISEKIYKYSAQAANHFAVRPVSPENMHITLKFFGEKNPADCLEVLEKSVKNADSFEVTVKGADFFSYGKYARVLRAGIDGESGALKKIALNIDNSQNKYVPHITLARFKGDSVKNEVLEKYLSENGIKEKVFGKFRIEKISLVESLLNKNAALYKILKDFYLGE